LFAKKLGAFALILSLMASAGVLVSESVTAYNNQSFQDLDNITADVSDLVINNMDSVITIFVVIGIIGLLIYGYKKIKKSI